MSESLQDVLREHSSDGYDYCSCGKRYSWDEGAAGWPAEHAEHVVQLWREFCTVRSVEELDALPDGTVVYDNGNLTWQRIDDFADSFADDIESRQGWHCVLGSGEPLELPALVLFRPDRETP